MLNTIGMSESVLKIMEKRGKADILIFFGMAILTLVLIYILYSYVRPWFWGTYPIVTNSQTVNTNELL
jgi:hypothetical protein